MGRAQCQSRAIRRRCCRTTVKWRQLEKKTKAKAAAQLQRSHAKVAPKAAAQKHRTYLKKRAPDTQLAEARAANDSASAIGKRQNAKRKTSVSQPAAASATSDGASQPAVSQGAKRKAEARMVDESSRNAWRVRRADGSSKSFKYAGEHDKEQAKHMANEWLAELLTKC